MPQKNGLRILEAEIKNFKGISYKKIDFDGRSVFIIGKNRAGKSSLIQAIFSPVDASFIPSEPIKKGEEKGHVELMIGGTLDGEKVKYTIGLYFSAEHKRGRLNVLNADGGKLGSKRAIVDSLVGAIGFDIMAFLRLGVTSSGKVSTSGVREQIELLKGFMPYDVKEAFSALEAEAKEVYSERAEKNLEIKNINGQIAEIELTQEEIDTYSVRKDAEVVTEKISKLSGEIEKWNRADTAQEQYRKNIRNIHEEMGILSDKLRELQKDMSVNEVNLQKTKKWIHKNPDKPSIDSLTEELTAINYHNSWHEEIMKLEKKQISIKDLEKVSEQKTSRLKSIQAEKQELFADNPLPVKDLIFDEDQIYYKGLPFNEDQHSTSVMIGVGIRIGMGKNPNLKLLTIKDGSLLDKETMKFILKICAKEGYQILIEKVDHEGGDLEVQFTES
jgi:hypothetical protein